MTTPALIFDIGGVVVDCHREYLFNRLIPDPARRRYFLDEVCPGWWNEEIDRGKPMAEAVADRVVRFPAWEPYIRAFHQRWPEMLNGLVPGAAELISDLLATGTTLYAITNWSADTYPITRAAYPVLAAFDHRVVVSAEVGLLKPDPRIYRTALERFGLTAAGCLFIDDNPANVAGALAVGLPAVRFTGADVLRAHPVVRAHLGERR